jgi:hypothetical protein
VSFETRWQTQEQVNKAGSGPDDQYSSLYSISSSSMILIIIPVYPLLITSNSNVSMASDMNTARTQPLSPINKLNHIKIDPSNRNLQEKKGNITRIQSRQMSINQVILAM